MESLSVVLCILLILLFVYGVRMMVNHLDQRTCEHEWLTIKEKGVTVWRKCNYCEKEENF